MICLTTQFRKGTKIFSSEGLELRGRDLPCKSRARGREGGERGRSPREAHHQQDKQGRKIVLRVDTFISSANLVFFLALRFLVSVL